MITFKKEENLSELLPAGKYECTIEKIEKRTTPTNGRNYANIQLRVRGDVEQECKNRVIFDTIWTSKDDNVSFDEHKINRMLGTQSDVKEGREFNTYEEVFEFLVGRYVKVALDKIVDTYDGKEKNKVKFYDTTEHPAQSLGGGSANLDQVVVDDDLPF